MTSGVSSSLIERRDQLPDGYTASSADVAGLVSVWAADLIESFEGGYVGECKIPDVDEVSDARSVSGWLVDVGHGEGGFGLPCFDESAENMSWVFDPLPGA